ncbi:MAG: hypothetical protein HC890_12355 [Chloroflexaceae bacterium]|nr:hypothetical protein [Chloroflexaceae bacterium]
MFLAAGTQDPATPVVYEQLRAFLWLKTPVKYFALVDGQAHVDISSLDGRATALLKTFPDLKFAEPGLIDSYGNSLGLTISEVFVAGKPEYRSYIHPAYASYISEAPFGIYLIEGAFSDELAQVYNQYNQGD